MLVALQAPDGLLTWLWSQAKRSQRPETVCATLKVLNLSNRSRRQDLRVCLGKSVLHRYHRGSMVHLSYLEMMLSSRQAELIDTIVNDCL